MKKILTLFTLVLIMGICPVSSADVLFYNVFGSVRAVDNLGEGFVRTSINGFLVMEVDHAQGAVIASTLILYGRDTEQSRVYQLYDEAVFLTLSGNAAVLTINPSQGAALVFTGTMRNTRLNFGRNPVTTYAAATMSGSLQLQWASLLDLNQTLVGEGSVTAMLNYQETRDAIAGGSAIDDVVNELIERLESREYIPVTDYEEPMPL